MTFANKGDKVHERSFNEAISYNILFKKYIKEIKLSLTTSHSHIGGLEVLIHLFFTFALHRGKW